MKFDDLRKYNCKEIESAGPRYTPGQDKNAPNMHIQALEDALDALSLSADFRKRTQELSAQLSKAIEDSSHEISKIFKRKKRTPQRLKCLLDQFSKASPVEAKRYVKEIKIVIRAINNAIRKREDQLFEIERKAREAAKDKTTAETESSQIRPDNHERYQLRRFEDSIGEIRAYFNSDTPELISNNCALLLGEWGTGKTHTLCDYAKKLTKEKHHCVFAIAQNFPLNTDPLAAICERSNLAKDMATLLANLEHYGKQNKCRALLIVDGINEGDREEWKIAVVKLYKQVHRLEHVGLILSCRSPFQNLLCNEAMLKAYKLLYHQGFREIEFEAQEEFFKYYKIPFPEVPLLSDEFSRPLTLKLICNALEHLTKEQKKSTFAGIASGQKGMTYVLEKYIQDLGTPIEKAFQLPGKFCWSFLKGTKKTKNGLEDGVAVRMASKQTEVLSYDETIEIILNVTDWTCEQKARDFLKSVVHSGILFEHYIWSDGVYSDAVKLPYQKFSDHIIARHLLDKHLKKDTIERVKRSFYAGQPLGSIFEISKFGREYNMPNWAEALMIEFPERIKKLGEDNRELVYYLPKSKRLITPSLEPLLNSLLWRPPTSFCHGTDLVISQLLEKDTASTRYKVLDTLLALSVKKDHPYSAKRLDKYLFAMDMPKRDLLWSEFLRKSYSESTVYKIISWSITASSQGITKRVAENCLTILMWFLTSVSKPQRDRATEAIIKLGFLFPDVLFKHTLYSLSINDPYVSERMLAASYGAAMNKWAENKKKFREPFLIFAKELVKEMFLPESRWATHNAISRDSALGCIEIARLIDKKCIATQYIKYLKPPFSHIKSPFKNPRGIRNYKIEAVKPALHMDFRNYTVGRLVPSRGNYQDAHPEYQAILKQIKGRMYDLGYRAKRFEEVDRDIPQYQNMSRSESPSKTDRYGKKYSWIAYYEMYGFRQANGLLDDDRSETRISDITFDPSLPIAPKPCSVKLPNVFQRKFRGFADWMINGPTPNYSNILVSDKIRREHGPWVLLDGFVQQSNPADKREIFSFLRGLLIETEKVEEFKEKYLSIEYPGNRSIPEASQDYYTFAGEIPWSHRHAPYLRYADGRSKRNIDDAFGGSEFVPYKRVVKESLPSIIKEDDGAISFFLGEVNKTGRWKRVPGVRVEIPAYTYSWEGYHSIVNDYSGFDVPAPAISNYLELSFRNQSAELFDKHGKRATIFTRFKDSDSTHNSHLLYIRKDLLEKYMAHTGQTMIWAIWGERDVHYKAMDQRNAEAQEHDVYKEHKHIHKAFFQYSKITS